MSAKAAVKPKPKPHYVLNQVVYSELSDRYYFVPKMRLINDSGLGCVVGKKYDVTESVRAATAQAKRMGYERK